MEKKNTSAHNTKAKQGKVIRISDKNTLKVRVESTRPDKKYGKPVKISKIFTVHTDTDTAKVGDQVYFTNCAPISKTKRHILQKNTSKTA